MRSINFKFVNNKILFCVVSLMVTNSVAFAYTERDDFIDSLSEKPVKNQNSESNSNQNATVNKTSAQSSSQQGQAKEATQNTTDVPSVNKAIVKKFSKTNENKDENNSEDDDSQEQSEKQAQTSKSHKKTKQHKLTREEALENSYLTHVSDFRKVDYTKPVIRDGVVYFNANHGQAIIFCAVSHVCDIRLEKNESADSVEIGDKLNWVVTRAKSGDKNENFYEHIDVKPVSLNIDTDLVINTNKRTYIINLKSTKSKRYFSSVAFIYDDSSEIYSHYAQDIQSTIPKESLFAYRIRGDKTTWTPTNISTDGKFIL